MNTLIRNLSIVGILTLAVGPLQAEFESGSNGEDGALVFEAGLGHVIFDPDDYNPVLDADRDGIYHFTNITVGSGTWVCLIADVLGHKPLIWLASGDVVIEGQLEIGVYEVNGAFSPGVGGFHGGYDNSFRDGQGPGGASNGLDASSDYINPYLIPLVGGSGDAAGNDYDGYPGGGAFLLASSGTIQIDGRFNGYGGHVASAGNLRLMANSVSGNGSLGGFNVLRMEAFQHSLTLNIDNSAQTIRTRPGAVFPKNPIKITVVDSELVDQTKPGANKGEPDVTIDNGNEVTIVVTCEGIPEGLPVRVVGWNDLVGEVEATTGPLVTTTGNITEASCKMVIPTGHTTFMAQVIMPVP